MFKRRIGMLFITLALAVSYFFWNFNTPTAGLVKSAQEYTSSERWVLDLSGQWTFYSSLRQAWTAEKKEGIGEGKINWLKRGVTGYLPSGSRFAVAAKTFKIPTEWSARYLTLHLHGVKGKVTVYINGIDSVNRVGAADQEGESIIIDVPLNGVHYGTENLILLKVTPSESRDLSLWDLEFSATGRITGLISLQATMETTMAKPMLKIAWEKETALVQVDLQLIHRGFSEKGPWFVQGIISDGTTSVAQDSHLVQLNEGAEHWVSLKFNVQNALKWRPEQPVFYQLHLTVLNPKGDKDDLTIPLALSALRFSEGQFLLEGQVIPIQGLAVLPERERVIRESGDIRAWFREQKAQGYNLLYFFQGFPDEIWFQEADRAGVGIWVELPETALIPGSRLQINPLWDVLIRKGSWHPSLWAYTVGTGVEVNPGATVSAYWQKVRALTAPVPAFFVRLTNVPISETAYAMNYSQGNLTGTLGRVDVPETKTISLEANAPMPMLRWLWLGAMLLVLWFNLVVKHWRYKELLSKRPKRALRKAWFWQGTALLFRQFTLAGITSSLLYTLELPWSPWLSSLWPFWEILKQQPPLFVWLVLGLSFTLIRLLQVGIAAPNMPESPEPIGLALWLERRNLWSWLIAFLWALESYTLPKGVSLAAYFGLSLLFLPFKIRDVHRINGNYRSFLIVPGLMAGVLLSSVVIHWQDWLYLSRLLWAHFH